MDVRSVIRGAESIAVYRSQETRKPEAATAREELSSPNSPENPNNRETPDNTPEPRPFRLEPGSYFKAWA